MAPTRRQFLGAASASSVMGLAGCGYDSGGDGGDSGSGTDGDTGSGTGDDTPMETPTPVPSGASIEMADHPDLGEILVDGDEMTLYMFDSDTQGDLASTCTDGCADAWPPVTTEGDPTAGDGVTASLETFERGDGGMQVAANGWPLYYFQNDESAGDANGQGVNDVWWVLGPDGTPKRPQQASVEVRSHPDYGDILVDGDGMTLYMFDSDEQGAGESTCDGSCANAWPPLTTDEPPAAGEGVDGELSTFEREDGGTQVAVTGWPLYSFQSDEEPGDASGQGVSGVWWVLDPSGTPNRSSPGTPTPTSTATSSDDGTSY